MKKLITSILMFCLILSVCISVNNIKAYEENRDTDNDINLNDTTEEESISPDEGILNDMDASSAYAWEAAGQTIQNTLSGPNTAYWNSNNTFLTASDIYGQTVPAYCLQPKKASPNQNVRLVEGNSVLSSDGLQAAACAIASYGYGGESADPNIELFGGSYNSLSGGSYASYVTDGQLRRGLMINGIIYELTPREAQALTGASIHYFSSLAGQGDSVDSPSGSKIDESHNNNILNAFGDLVFIGSHFMNNYGCMEYVAYAVENGTDWEKVLDDYSASFSWKVKTKSGEFVDFYPQADNVFSDDKYLINQNGKNNLIIKLTISASKCSLKLIDQESAASMSGSANVLPNSNTISMPNGEKRSFDYFYVSSNKSCTVEYGPLYNDTVKQIGPFSILDLPTFNQDVIISIPEESLESGILINADTLTGFSATPVYGDGDSDGIANYSARLFSDANSEKDYQDILFFSPGNTFSRHTSAQISGSFKYYGTLELYKSSSNKEISDKNNNYSLKDAVYAVYKNNKDASRNQNPITTLTTDINGYAKSVKLEAGTYYVKEVSAPKGYTLDNSIYTVVIDKGNSSNEITQNKTYLNETPFSNPVDILLYKTDEAGNPLGDAEFTVKFYNILSENNPADNGYTPVKTWVFKTDSSTGYAHFNNKYKISGDEFYYVNQNVVLPLGTITIEETKAPEGYEENHYVEVQKIYSKNNNSPQILAFNPPEIKNKKIRQAVEFNKLGEIKSDTYTVLKGAGFMACPVSDLEQDEDGKYIWNNEKAVTLTDDGKKEIFTDENGYAKTIPLEYGTYIFKETTVPINFLPVDDIIVNINSSTPEVKTLETIHDKGFNIYLHVDKTCSYSKEKILNNPAEFSIWSYEEEAYLTFNNSEILKTDENGELITPSPLFPGNYRLDEIKAPDGYELSEKKGIDFSIDQGDIIELTPYENSCGLLTLTVENQLLSGEIKRSKLGECMIYDKDKKLFNQDTTPLQDVVFGIYAYEDIYTSDGHNTIIYHKDDKVAEITTDSDGNANSPKLPYGKYLIKELKTPENYVSAEDKIVTIDKSSQTETITNNLLKTKLSLIKKSEDENIPLENATYAIYEYNSEFVTAKDYRNSNCIEQKTTDSEGTINFETLLPPGKYTVIETKAPEGYYISDEIETINTYASSEDTLVMSANQFENLSIVSSAYSGSGSISENESYYRDMYNYYTLSVTDKKIPKNPKSPKTGDNFFLVTSIMFLTGIVLLFNLIKASRKEKGNSK